MASLPTGTVTFLFTDIEGSTRLLQQLGDIYAGALAQYRQILRSAVQERGGREVHTQGDSLFFAFARATDAVAAAVVSQRTVNISRWPQGCVVRVRMGLHTGEPISAQTDYVGMDVHRVARIGDAGHGGQILLSEATHGLIANDLPEGIRLRDLGEHRLRDLSHHHRLFQVVTDDLSADFPPLRSMHVLPNNLPRQLSSFVGRRREIAEIMRRLSTISLLTITGVGGVGKTRLALQVAAESLERYADGVWSVELGALADPGLVPQTVASALGVREEPGCSIIETLLEYLRPKTLLLVLDNCEHLLSACAQLADSLLRGCPTVKILATGREGLGIAGETLYPVPSLSFPEPSRLPPIELLTQYDAIHLFAERATAIVPTFAVTERNAEAVVQICRRVDGIPLAVELAAARVKVLPVDQIASRLNDEFRLLTGGSRMALPRHQTLRAAMDWSYDLLLEKERVTLRRLSVFAGGWTLEAAEAVCAWKGIEASEVLDLQAHLVDKSLVLSEEHDGKGRYRLLETVRQYSRDRLLESGEVEIARRRHRDIYLALAEDAATHLNSPNQVTWLDRLEAEHDNLRAALEWSLGQGETAAVLQLVRGLHEFWSIRCYWSEGLKWLEVLLSTTSDTPSPVRAWALNVAGATARRLGDNRRAMTLLEEAIATFRSLKDQKGLAESLRVLGIVTYRQADYRRATAVLEEAISLSRALDHKPVVASSLYLLGVVARLRGDYRRAEALCEESCRLSEAQALKHWAPPAFATDGLGLVALCRGDYERAKTLCEKALALHKQEGYRSGIIASLNSLSLVACVQGDYEGAVALCDECLALSRKMGDKAAIARAINVLGRVAFRQGNCEQAMVQHLQSLALFRELGETLGIIQSMERLGIAAASEPERTARLFAAAERLREAIGAPLPTYDRADYASAVDSVRVALSEPAFATVWGDGRAMTLEQAIEYALQGTLA